MTEQERAELGPEFFERMVESVGVGVAIYDADGVYRYVNGAYADILDTDRESLIGTPMPEVVVGFDGDRFDDYWDSFEEGDTRISEAEHEFGGTRVPVNTVTTCRHIDGTPYHFGTILDITERREQERRLREQNERLEAFTGIVSHDLRNPLGVAKGYLDLAQAETDADELDLVESALDRMELLIDDLLTLAREGRAVDETRPVSVGYVASEAWEHVRTPNAELDVAGGFTVEADSTRLQQLFENLFRNALEHGSDDVCVHVGELDDGGFFVEDDGPGIPPAERERVFQAGYTSSDTGTGFGLTIVEEIAEGHGWSMTLTESEDGGARFEFRTDGGD